MIYRYTNIQRENKKARGYVEITRNCLIVKGIILTDIIRFGVYLTA
jgi:hypothetical protein